MTFTFVEALASWHCYLLIHIIFMLMQAIPASYSWSMSLNLHSHRWFCSIWLRILILTQAKNKTKSKIAHIIDSQTMNLYGRWMESASFLLALDLYCQVNGASFIPPQFANVRRALQFESVVFCIGSWTLIGHIEWEVRHLHGTDEQMDTQKIGAISWCISLSPSSFIFS